MIEHLEKRMYVNSIENENFLELARKIESENLEPIVLSSNWYIFKNFYKLLKKEISLEEFYMTWDLDSEVDLKLSFFRNPYDALEYLKLQSPSKEKVYVFDKIFKSSSNRADIFYI